MSPILVINAGSSSLKFGTYVTQDGDQHISLDGLADGIGRGTGKLELKDRTGASLRSQNVALATPQEALAHAAKWLVELSPKPIAIGHRIVHGGPRLVTHQPITPLVMKELAACVHFAPLHIPPALRLIEESQRTYPGVPQFACFDTAFHSTIPEVASRLPIPEEFSDEGIRRYGFHGISYESIVHQLRNDLPPRIVIAHLGNGASLAAVKNGKSVDTTMGLTPTGGIPMATRSGDLDPGVLLFLMRSNYKTPDSLEDLLNRHSGMIALSGGKSDIRDLEPAADAGDQKAKLAIDIFCRAISKTIASYGSVLGGLDLLVFSGGIGEHSARVRSTVCRDLGFLGICLDETGNKSHAAGISTAQSKVRVMTVASEEDRQIARHCSSLLEAQR